MDLWIAIMVGKLLGTELIISAEGRTITSVPGVKVIQWTMDPVPPPSSKVTVLHPSGDALFTALETAVIPAGTDLGRRVSNTDNTNTTKGRIEFTLNGITVEDAGDYITSCNTEGGTTNNVGVTLVVYVQPSKPDLTLHTIPIVGQDMMWRCDSASNSKPTGHKEPMVYKWYINGAELPAKRRYVAKGSNLQVVNIERSDKESTFTCFGYETPTLPSNISDGSTPDVEYGPGELTISPNTLQYTKRDISAVGQITCSADCNPACAYQWKFNGRGIGGQSNVLTLRSIQRKAAGEYMCTATNDHGTSNSRTITVSVPHGPRRVYLSPSTQKYTFKEDAVNALNRITCSADCNPDCSFQWSRDGTVIRNTSVLWLTNITRDDIGTYSCSARNSHGSKNSANVDVTAEYGNVKLLRSQIQLEVVTPVIGLVIILAGISIGILCRFPRTRSAAINAEVKSHHYEDVDQLPIIGQSTATAVQRDEGDVLGRSTLPPVYERINDNGQGQGLATIMPQNGSYKGLGQRSLPSVYERINNNRTGQVQDETAMQGDGILDGMGQLSSPSAYIRMDHNKAKQERDSETGRQGDGALPTDYITMSRNGAEEGQYIGTGLSGDGAYEGLGQRSLPSVYDTIIVELTTAVLHKVNHSDAKIN